MKFLAKLFLTFFYVNNLYPQSQFRDSSIYIYPFVKYLFCTGDYLRTSNELQRLIEMNQTSVNEDTLNFLLGKSFQKLEQYEKSDEYFSKFYNSPSPLKGFAIREYIKNQFLNKNDFYFYKLFSNAENYEWMEYFYTLKIAAKLRALSDSEIEKDLMNVRDISRQLFLAQHIAKMRLIEKKDPVTAGILSAIIPGSGKIYTEKYSDGIVSFLLTGIFGFLAYDNFSAGHKFRGWLFSGIGSFLYAGNIYGSIMSAKIFNSEKNDKYRNDLFDGLSKNNFFIDEIIFCP